MCCLDQSFMWQESFSHKFYVLQNWCVMCWICQWDPYDVISTGIPRNNWSKSHSMLSLTEHVWEFQKMHCGILFSTPYYILLLFYCFYLILTYCYILYLVSWQRHCVGRLTHLVELIYSLKPTPQRPHKLEISVYPSLHTTALLPQQKGTVCGVPYYSWCLSGLAWAQLMKFILLVLRWAC